MALEFLLHLVYSRVLVLPCSIRSQQRSFSDRLLLALHDKVGRVLCHTFRSEFDKNSCFHDAMLLASTAAVSLSELKARLISKPCYTCPSLRWGFFFVTALYAVQV